jgi:hypothetical protein
MNIKYTNDKWLNRQVKMIENKCRKVGKSYNTGISRELTNKAILELRDCDENGCVMVLDFDQFNLNKKMVLEKYL